MDRMPNDAGFEGIGRLIRDEERAALESFRRKDFRRAVEARMAAAPGRTGSHRWGWRLALAAGAAAALLAAGWGIFSGRTSAPPVVGQAPSVLLAGLERLPGMAGAASGQAFKEAEAEPAGGAPASIREVLDRVRAKATERAEGPPPGASGVGRLSLEKKMIILFKERAIERVLILVRKKTQEA